MSDQEGSEEAIGGQSLPIDEFTARRVRRIPQGDDEITEQIRRAAAWALEAADDPTMVLASTVFDPAFDPVLSRDLICFLVGLLKAMHPESLGELRERWL